jgi:hypothetical protein
LAHKNVLYIPCGLVCVLHSHTLRVDEVVI